MKVLIVHTSYKYKGGEDTVVAEEMELLKINGVTVELLQFNNNHNSFFKILQLPFNLLSYLKTKKKLKAYPADVVHIHNLHFAASASVLYAIKRSKIPFVMTLHNYRLLCPSATLSSKGKLFLVSIQQKFPWKAIAQKVYKNSAFLTFWVALSMKVHQRIGTWRLCRRYIVLSPHARKLFLESNMAITNDRLTVKPNFCTAPLSFQPVEDNYFLYVGRLIEEKGTQLLLNVFASCGYKIKIAGDGPLRNEVISYSDRFPNIEFLGALKKAEIFKLLGSCSALIFPSIWYEGMPLTIIEAFACGAPVISSKMGAMENMITHNYNGLHFEPASKDDLIRKLDEWQGINRKEKISIAGMPGQPMSNTTHRRKILNN